MEGCILNVRLWVSAFKIATESNIEAKEEDRACGGRQPARLFQRKQRLASSSGANDGGVSLLIQEIYYARLFLSERHQLLFTLIYRLSDRRDDEESGRQAVQNCLCLSGI